MQKPKEAQAHQLLTSLHYKRQKNITNHNFNQMDCRNLDFTRNANDTQHIQ
jgi:hypothetical protein